MYCTYCHRAFGSVVTWHGRPVALRKEREHIRPKAAGGTKTVPACQLCNRIKGSMSFQSLAEIQEFCLDALLRDGSITKEFGSKKIPRKVRRRKKSLRPITPYEEIFVAWMQQDSHVKEYQRTLPRVTRYQYQQKYKEYRYPPKSLVSANATSSANTTSSPNEKMLRLSRVCNGGTRTWTLRGGVLVVLSNVTASSQLVETLAIVLLVAVLSSSCRRRVTRTA